MPWLPPATGQEIIVPYNLRVVASTTDSLLTIAYRFLGDRDKAWMLDRYNHRKEAPLRRGDVVLVPLVDLTLTEAGRLELTRGGVIVCSEGAGATRQAQHRAAADLPLLLSDAREGRWAEAIALGNRVLGYGELTAPDLAAVQKTLTVAYSAIDATGLAATACKAWRDADKALVLDPVQLSPKILRVCLGPTTAGNHRPVEP